MLPPPEPQKPEEKLIYLLGAIQMSSQNKELRTNSLRYSKNVIVLSKLCWDGIGKNLGIPNEDLTWVWLLSC